MTLKAVLFDFNGVIINDEPIHQELIDEILLGENLQPSGTDFQKFCLGRSDRACLMSILQNRGRFVTDDYLNKLIQKKNLAYEQRLQQLDKLPIYPEVRECLHKIKEAGLIIGLVTGALGKEVELILNQAQIRDYFQVIVTGDDIKTSKPAPDGYLLAVERLKCHDITLGINPEDCLVIEDTPVGIEAAKKARMQVMGVANTYPFHIIQRQTNWCVDYLSDIELNRIQQVFAGMPYAC